MPKNDKQQEFIQWTFDCNDSAVEEQRQAMDAENRIGMYPEAQFEVGANSREWAEMPTCSQQMTLSEQIETDALRSSFTEPKMQFTRLSP